jgi:hypothetical protein
MVEDTRRFKSTDEMMNAVFGSVPLSDEQRRQKEAEHKAAQAPKVAAPEPPKRPGYTPPGYRSNATVSEFAFRDMRPPTEAELQRDIRKSMRDEVARARGVKGG